ncbi:hypothetical protein DSO57_1000001 [Entomophthora muscae]|uniref:Uncharacterized protein n=1 Tax=Entomophthora muscae TaxID=34485 RepID=A0ACC2SMR2_9FUNG|nr:hypothetical protein DSO57_1000001 [Entomophthora muscae]
MLGFREASQYLSRASLDTSPQDFFWQALASPGLGMSWSLVPFECNTFPGVQMSTLAAMSTHTLMVEGSIHNAHGQAPRVCLPVRAQDTSDKLLASLALVPRNA